MKITKPVHQILLAGFPCPLREGLIGNLHASHPVTWEMMCMSTQCWWPYMNRELIVKSTECKLCTAIGKNIESAIPAKQFHSHIPCAKPNQEKQMDVGGPIFDEIGHEIYLLAALDCFSNFLIACILEKVIGPNVLKFLNMYHENHGVPRSIRLNKAKRHVGHQVKIFCNKIILKFLRSL